MGVEVTAVTPEVNPAAVDTELWDEAYRRGLYKQIDTDTTTIKSSLEKVIAESDIVYTDTWVDMEFFTDPAFAKERKRRLEKMMPYQVNAQLLNGHECRIMPCLLAHHRYEISGEIVNDPRSIIFEQSENHLYGMKASLFKLLT